MDFYFSKECGLAFSDAVEKAKGELKKEGFGVLTEIDVRDTLKKKIDADFRNYRILGACNPPFALQALQAEDKIGVMLPCNVIVQEKDGGKVEVAAINPLASMESVGNDRLAEIAAAVAGKLRTVIDGI